MIKGDIDFATIGKTRVGVDASSSMGPVVFGFGASGTEYIERYVNISCSSITGNTGHRDKY
jgi:hypothetical protein